MFEGEALEWFRYIRSQVNSWFSLIDRLKQTFLDSDYDIELLNQISQRMQGSKERVKIFVAIMERYVERLSFPLPEEQHLRTVFRNLLPDLQSQLSLNPPATLRPRNKFTVEPGLQYKQITCKKSFVNVSALSNNIKENSDGKTKNSKVNCFSEKERELRLKYESERNILQFYI